MTTPIQFDDFPPAMSRIRSNFLWLAITVVSCTAVDTDHTPSDHAPPGHMQPLGSHIPPLSIDTLLTPPDPVTFNTRYVNQNKPLKLTGLLKDHQVIKNWQNDEYLRTHFGNVMVHTETGKKENRSNFATVMQFSEFLNMYKSQELYVVSNVPDEMRGEWPLPPFISCGGYTDNLAMLYLWFSSGGTKSVLHTDSYENMHCVVSGVKTFLLIEPHYSQVIGPEHASQGYYNMDVDAVNMTQYPRMTEVPWYQVDIEPGDCLYLPLLWIHQVRSSGRNMGVNLWWIPFQFNKGACTQREGGTDGHTFASDVTFTPELQVKWFLLQCKRVGGAIHATDVHRQLTEKLQQNVPLEAVVQALEMIVPDSQGVIHETDFDKTPVSVYQQVMEYLMRIGEEGGVATEEDMWEEGVATEEDMWEGGGDGHASHSTRDEL